MTINCIKYNIIYLFLILFIFNYNESYSASYQGCCSYHGGVSYTCTRGHVLCNDGTLSSNCLCDNYNNYKRSKDILIYPKMFKNWGIMPYSRQSSNEILITSNNKYTDLEIEFNKLDYSSRNQCFNFLTSPKIYASTKLRLPIKCNKYSNNNILYYSIDNSSYYSCNIKNIDIYEMEENNSLSYSVIDFCPLDGPEFYNKCQKGREITFIFNYDGIQFYATFSLLGLTSASNAAINILID